MYNNQAVKIKEKADLNKVTWACYGTKGLAIGHASYKLFGSHDKKIIEINTNSQGPTLL